MMEKVRNINSLLIVHKIKKQWIRWEAHIQRQPDNGLVMLVWEEAPIGKRSLDRPRIKQPNKIRSNQRAMNLEYNPHLMVDWTCYKQMVQSANTHYGL